METIGLTDVSAGTPTSASFNPYDTTQLHAFIKGSFSGAVLMEEHQVHYRRCTQDRILAQVLLALVSTDYSIPKKLDRRL